MNIDFTLFTNYGMFVFKRTMVGDNFNFAVDIPDTLEEYLDDDAMAYNAAIDGVHSFLLAMYSAGIDMNTPVMVEAINTAIEAIGNNFS